MRKKLALTCLVFVITGVMLTGTGYAFNLESAIAVWMFDEGRGEEAKDLSINGHHATLNNGTQWVDGKFGAGLSFDGKNDYVSISESQDWDLGSGDFTIMLWFFPRAQRKTALITSKTDYWAGIMFHYQGTRNIDIWASSTGRNWDIIHSDPGGNGIGKKSVPLKEWSHAAYVRSGKRWMSYVNGVEDVRVNGGGRIVDRIKEEKIIGRWGNPADRGWLDGIVDEVAIFDVALSEDEIQRVMKTGLAQLAVSPSGKLAISWGKIKTK